MATYQERLEAAKVKLQKIYPDATIEQTIEWKRYLENEHTGSENHRKHECKCFGNRSGKSSTGLQG